PHSSEPTVEFFRDIARPTGCPTSPPELRETLRVAPACSVESPCANPRVLRTTGKFAFLPGYQTPRLFQLWRAPVFRSPRWLFAQDPKHPGSMQLCRPP